LPYTISSSGYYKVTASISNGTATALAINADNVVVDGQNYLINGLDSGSTYAIAVQTNRANIIIFNINTTREHQSMVVYSGVHNLLVDNWTTGSEGYSTIEFQQNCYNFTIQNCNIGSTGGPSINTGSGCYDFYIRNNTITNTTLAAIETYISSSATVTNNTIQGAQFGIKFSTNTSNSVASSNNITNCQYGLGLYGTTNTSIYNNFLNNNNTLYEDGTTRNTYFNTSRQQGTRIYTNGGYIGGNYWAAPSNTGVSQTVTDNDGNGFIDIVYNVSGSICDYLAYSGNATAFTITSTADPHSTISPSGNTTIYYGASQAYTFSANANYDVKNLTVDGSSASTTSPYTFNPVTANHTISVYSEASVTPTTTASDGSSGSSGSSGHKTPSPTDVLTSTKTEDYTLLYIVIAGAGIAVLLAFIFKRKH